MREYYGNNQISVTALIDDAAPGYKTLCHEHGLSLFIHAGGQNILFDCGSTDRLLHNARRLNIDLADIDVVVLSHGHFDHGGGFRTVAELSGVKRLITGRSFFTPKYRLEGLRNTYMGVDFDPEYLAAHHIVHEICGGLVQLNDDCWVIGDFPRVTGGETIPAYSMVLENGEFEPDPFDDEVCLATRMDDGLAVFVGCSHPGLINMLTAVRDRIGLPIHGVWGGTHLLDAGPERLAMTLDAVKKMGIRQLGFSHCSGTRINEMLAQDPDVTQCCLRTGDGLLLRHA